MIFRCDELPGVTIEIPILPLDKLVLESSGLSLRDFVTLHVRFEELPEVDYTLDVETPEGAAHYYAPAR